jgi:hypothetical protein
MWTLFTVVLAQAGESARSMGEIASDAIANPGFQALGWGALFAILIKILPPLISAYVNKNWKLFWPLLLESVERLIPVLLPKSAEELEKRNIKLVRAGEDVPTEFDHSASAFNRSYHCLVECSAKKPTEHSIALHKSLLEQAGNAMLVEIDFNNEVKEEGNTEKQCCEKLAE